MSDDDDKCDKCKGSGTMIVAREENGAVWLRPAQCDSCKGTGKK